MFGGLSMPGGAPPPSSGPGGGGGPPGAGGLKKYSLYVGNVDATITLDQVKAVFGQFGPIVTANLHGKESDPFRFAFIDYMNEPDRDKALSTNGYSLGGRVLKVGIGAKNSQQNAAAAAAATAPASTPQAPPMPSGAGGAYPGDPGMGGGAPYPGGPGMGAPFGYEGGPMPPFPGGHGFPHHRGGRVYINEPPPEEITQLRELQKKQYFEAVQKTAEAYRQQLSEKLLRKAQRGNNSDSDSDAEDGDDDGAKKDKKEKKSKKEKKDKKRSRSRSEEAAEAPPRPTDD